MEGALVAYLQVASSIRWHVIQWQLRPGTPMPAEYELAELYGVHRDTMRRAYDILRRYGMLETKRGSGTFVKRRAEM
jgi:DNA-binding GntR family transcriptional regulator